MSRMGWKFMGMATALAVMLTAAAAKAQSAAPETPTPTPTPTAASADAAATTPKKAAAPKHVVKKKTAKKQAPTVTLVVINSRPAVLTSLIVTPASGGEGHEIARGLAPGTKTTVKIEHDADCLFDIHGDFEDGATSDAPSINLCKDKAISLKD